MLSTSEFDSHYRQFTVLSQIQVSLEAFDASISEVRDTFESWTPDHHELLAKALTPIVKPIGATGYDIIPSYESDHSLVASMEALEEAKQEVIAKQKGLLAKMFGALRKVASHFNQYRTELARKQKELSYMGTKLVAVDGGVYTTLLGPKTEDFNIFRYVERVKRLASLLSHPDVCKHRSGIRHQLMEEYRHFEDGLGGGLRMIRHHDHRGFKGPFMSIYKDLSAAVDKLEQVKLDQLLNKEEAIYQKLMITATPEEQNQLTTEGARFVKELKDIYEQVYKILMSVSVSSEVEPVDYYYNRAYNQ